MFAFRQFMLIATQNYILMPNGKSLTNLETTINLTGPTMGFVSSMAGGFLVGTQVNRDI